MSAPFLLALRIGMTLSLYFLIGWVFLLLWRSFKNVIKNVVAQNVSGALHLTDALHRESDQSSP